jgi:hypothetical protein
MGSTTKVTGVPLSVGAASSRPSRPLASRSVVSRSSAKIAVGEPVRRSTSGHSHAIRVGVTFGVRRLPRQERTDLPDRAAGRRHAHGEDVDPEVVEGELVDGDIDAEPRLAAGPQLLRDGSARVGGTGAANRLVTAGDRAHLAAGLQRLTIDAQLHAGVAQRVRARVAHPAEHRQRRPSLRHRRRQALDHHGDSALLGGPRRRGDRESPEREHRQDERRGARHAESASSFAAVATSRRSPS